MEERNGRGSAIEGKMIGWRGVIEGVGVGEKKEGLRKM